MPDPTPAQQPRGSRRIEAVLARIGLVTVVFGVVVAIIAIDVALTPEKAPETNPVGHDFSLVTPEGEQLGQRWEGGVDLMISPTSLYRNRPDEQRGINSLSLRGPEVDPGHTRPRAIFVGGSAVYGPGAVSFVGMLARRNAEVEFLNAGVIGYLTQQEVALIAFELLTLEPDLVVAFNGWNDLYDRYWWMRYGEPGTPHRGVNVTWNFIERRLQDFRRVEWEPSYAVAQAIGSVVRGSTLLSGLVSIATPPPTPLGPTPIPDALVDEAVEAYVENMTVLRDLAQSRGAAFLVTLQPELGQLIDVGTTAEARDAWASEWALDPLAWSGYFEDFPPAYRLFRERVKAELAERGIDVLDASTQLGMTGAGFDDFTDPVHYTRQGHKRIADLISRHLDRKGWPADG